jgi:hypothetical protein
LGKDILRGLAAGKRSGALAPAFETWKLRMAETARAAQAQATQAPSENARTEGPRGADKG